ncbi:outer membrane protein assembly factor BamB family protein, partial [Corallococcus sicarius]|uniref:outer membrane protein assembly factor BamB family protein n=1 Tax=Corallococcus sicarius TaxID=2316726 RepID=UPI0011C413B3
PPPPRPPPKPRRSSVAGCLVVGLVTVGTAVPVAVLALRGPRLHWGRSSFTLIPPDRATAFQWENLDAPAFLDVNGDGTDDVIGHIRRFVDSKSQELVAAFDGRTLAMLWETPPNEGAGALRTTKVIAQGGKLVMSGPRSLTLLEAKTGKPLGSVPLSDAPERLCVPSGDTESVWVEVLDEQHLLLNTRTGTARPAPRAPPNCVTPPLSARTCGMGRPVGLTTTCESTDELPSDIRGFTARYIFRAGDFLVATGIRSPGTGVPLVAVFEKGHTTPLWHGNVADTDPTHLRDMPPETAELDGDSVYFLYELAQQGGFHLIRRDARTGAVRWDVPVPRSKVGSGPSALWIHAGRVYVPHWTWLDVFEAETGHLVGTLGRFGLE